MLILTRTDSLAYLGNVTVAPLTRTIRGLESEVVLTSEEDGVPTTCAVSLDNIATVRKAIVDKRIAVLTEEKMRDVFDAIRFVFAIPRV